jgi:GNAT superfamily N-acetyltransferase
MNIYQISDNRGEICEVILRSLPEWFGIESAIRAYARNVQSMPVFVAELQGTIVGFLAVEPHNQYTAELCVMGVLRQFHRLGVGRGLVEHAESYLRQHGFEFFSVKTLAATPGEGGYDSTRRFYLAMGFRPVEVFSTLWGDDNPCLMMIKSIERKD